MGSRRAPPGGRQVLRPRSGRHGRRRVRRQDRGPDSRRHLGASPGGATRRRKRLVGRDVLQRVERDIMLQVVDTQWKDHLYSLDHLKEGIGLRGYGQRDPLVEYKKESFALFQDMKARIDEETVQWLFRMRAAARRRRRAGRAPARRAARGADDPLRARRRRGRRVLRIRPGCRVSRAGRRAATGAHRRRRRAREDGAPRRAEGRTQRPLPVRQREEVQEVPRGPGLRDDAWMCTQ